MKKNFLALVLFCVLLCSALLMGCGKSESKSKKINLDEFAPLFNTTRCLSVDLIERHDKDEFIDRAGDPTSEDSERGGLIYLVDNGGISDSFKQYKETYRINLPGIAFSYQRVAIDAIDLNGSVRRNGRPVLSSVSRDAISKYLNVGQKSDGTYTATPTTDNSHINYTEVAGTFGSSGTLTYFLLSEGGNEAHLEVAWYCPDYDAVIMVEFIVTKNGTTSYWTYAFIQNYKSNGYAILAK